MHERFDRVAIPLVRPAEATMRIGHRENRMSDQFVGDLQHEATARERRSNHVQHLGLQVQQTHDPVVTGTSLGLHGLSEELDPWRPIASSADCQEIIAELVTALLEPRR